MKVTNTGRGLFIDGIVVAIVNEEKKTIMPCHGYFPPHKYGIASKKYAKDNGYEYIGAS